GRPLAAVGRPRPLAVPHAAHSDADHRRDRRARRRLHADRRARPAGQHRHAVRVRDRLARRARAAPARAEPRPPVPHAVGAGRADRVGAGLAGADGEPARLDLAAPGDLDGDRRRAVLRLRRAPQPAQRANWNQLRFTKSPPGPVNVMNSVCTPVTDCVRSVVTLPHDCQPPVLLTEKLLMIGPVVLSSRYVTVPVVPDPDARRVVTRSAVGDPKSSPGNAIQSPGAIQPTFCPPPVSVVFSSMTPDCEPKLSAWIIEYG